MQLWKKNIACQLWIINQNNDDVRDKYRYFDKVRRKKEQQNDTVVKVLENRSKILKERR